MGPTGSIRSYVTTFKIVYFTLDKSRDSELENGISYTTVKNCISYTTVEEQWECNFALKDEKLVTFKKMAHTCFGTYWRALLCLHPFRTLQSFSPAHLFKASHVRPCTKQPKISRLNPSLYYGCVRKFNLQCQSRLRVPSESCQIVRL